MLGGATKTSKPPGGKWGVGLADNRSAVQVLGRLVGGLATAFEQNDFLESADEAASHRNASGPRADDAQIPFYQRSGVEVSAVDEFQDGFRREKLDLEEY